MSDDDDRLRKTFAKLRAADARRAPSFEEVRKRRVRRTSPWAVLVPAASAFAAAAVLILWCKQADDAPMATSAPAASVAAPAASGGEAANVAVALPVAVDDAPLDFLLDVPGLRGAPNFDTSLLRGSLR